MSLLSECCGFPPLGEVFDGIGFCGDCKDHASFEDDDDQHDCHAGPEDGCSHPSHPKEDI